MQQNTQLSEEQKKLFQIIKKTQNNIFITGKAGTGKSHLLEYTREHLKKNTIVVAPTGVAALNVRGQTIHSLFRLPPAFLEQRTLRPEKHVNTLLEKIDSVIIDEVSMVRADLMDAIDLRLRQAKQNTLPFGGVQMVLFGDLYQLPPIVADKELEKHFHDNHGGFYFFHADVFKKANLDIYELTTIFRQTDSKFIEILNAIRNGEVSERQLFDLNERSREIIPPKEVIVLATTNKIVNKINEEKLRDLPEEPYEYEARVIGKLETSNFPTDQVLTLKKGAQVMMMKNDKDGRWVNGTLATISDLKNDLIKVKIEGAEYEVKKETWSKIRYYYDKKENKIKEEETSAFTQYPVRLAWAVTIHKSQGQTYDRVAINLGYGSFAHGQTYVALSRARSIDGLFLSRQIQLQDIIVDKTIVDFMSQATIIST